MENSNVFIITGNQGEGKTTFLKGILSELKQTGIKTAGFYAEGKWKDDVRVKLDMVDIQIFSITNPVVFGLNTTKKAAAQIIAERLNLLK